MAGKEVRRLASGACGRPSSAQISASLCVSLPSAFMPVPAQAAATLNRREAPEASHERTLGIVLVQQRRVTAACAARLDVQLLQGRAAMAWRGIARHAWHVGKRVGSQQGNHVGRRGAAVHAAAPCHASTASHAQAL